MTTVGRNERCPCGSGLKFKKCCLLRQSGVRYTREERASGWTKLEQFIESNLGSEDDAALEEFWGRWSDHPQDLDEDLNSMSEQALDLWFAFDRPLEDGQRVVDVFLKAHEAELTAGEKLYLHTLRQSSMQLYEITDVRPGESLTLRNVIEGDTVVIQERLGSRTLGRFEWIVARVLTSGASGKPEMEGVLPIAPPYHESLRDGLRKRRDKFMQEHPGKSVTDFYKNVPPGIHEMWVGSILEPFVPQLANTDGEELVITHVLFDVLDRLGLGRALDAMDGVTRDETDANVWHWSGKNTKGKPVSLGVLKVGDDTLMLEANSVARAERGRALVEVAAGQAICYRATTHEDMQRTLGEDLRKRETTKRSDADGIPPEVQEALVLDHYSQHYRKWLDEPVPALDGHTPREAAGDRLLRPRLIELLHDLDRQYQQALKMGAPAFEPSWMWDELALDAERLPHPPPLAYERMAQLLPGSGELSHSVAESIRRQPGFDDRATVVSENAARENLEIQRFLRQDGIREQAQRLGANVDLGEYLRLMVNFDIHRHKAFWVDESLAYMLAQTDLDVLGRELRMPFPSFALVFTDRHVLSLAERLAARRSDWGIAGQYQHVLTVFVTEHEGGGQRALELRFAMDTMGADLPCLMTQRVPVADDQPVQAFLDALVPAPAIEPAVANPHPLRGLLQVVLNAILYATSAGVEAAPRKTPAKGGEKPRARQGTPTLPSSEAVFFLPGAIEISQVRRLQELERGPDGRAILRRFMVRGHWRRANRNWEDQRVRWIAPYWKGPDMAAVIERAYKLKP